ncbi:MAG: DUF4340 domain-containing protein [Planctomycetota bacterium]|nr:DUF4340 domain-containing protein [Planctomycetota bacterium]
MTWRILGTLWIAAAAALFAAWSAHQSRHNQRDVQPMLLGDGWAVHLIQQLDIKDESGAIRFNNDAGVWEQTEPFEWSIDVFAVRDLLGTIERLAVSRREEFTPILKPTDTVVRLTREDGAWIELVPSDRAAAGRAWIGIRQSVDNTTASAWSRVTTRDDLHSELENNPPRSWRMPSVLSTAGAETSRIALRSTLLDQPLIVERLGARWMVTSPITTRANQGGVDRWIESLQRLAFSQSVADAPSDLAAYGLTAPLVQIAVSESSGRTETLLVGQPCTPSSADRFAMQDRVPFVFTLDDVALRGLQPQLAVLIAPEACGVAVADVFSIEWTRDGALVPSWRIERDNDKWLISVPSAEGGEKQSASDRLVAQLLTALTTAPATEIALQEMPTELVVGSIVLRGIDGQELVTVVVGREAPPALRWAMSDTKGLLRIYSSQLMLPFDELTSLVTTVPPE